MGVPEFTNADVAQLLKIQNEVRDVLKKYSSNTPAIVPAVALVRIAKELLDVYPEVDRKPTIDDIIVPFIKGETSMPSRRRGASRLILPPGFKFDS